MGTKIRNKRLITFGGLRGRGSAMQMNAVAVHSLLLSIFLIIHSPNRHVICTINLERK